MQPLHVDQGFPDPLENCLRLQRVVRGIKRSQGALPSRPCLPVSSNILRIIYSALDLNSFDDVMFWAACLLAYFGFLRSAKFTVPSSSAFNPSIHLPVSDVSVDVPLNPSCHQVFIKASKTDPFRKGCNILIGLGSPPLCAVQAVVSYLAQCSHGPGPLFLLENVLPLTCSLVTGWLRAILLSAGLPGDFSSLSFLNWGSHFCSKSWCSRSPYSGRQPVEKWCQPYKQYVRTPPGLITHAGKSLVE